jgi:tetratricopeptide (TPR) repeat protein
MRPRLIVLLGLAVFAVAAPLHAVPTPEQRKVARVHYEAAVNHFNLGEYAEAAEEFRQVYRAAPQPVLLYDAAQAYRLAGQSEAALTLYESFLRQAPNAPVRGEVERRIGELKGKHEAKPETKTETPTTKTETPTTKTDAPKAQLTKAPDAAGGSERLKPVAELIKSNRKGFRECFDKWSNAHPGVAGKVKLTFYLDPDGNMDQAEAEESGFEAPDVAACIENFAGTLKYPKSASGKFTRFAYPFDFKPAR